MTESLNSGRAFLDAGPGSPGSMALDQTLPWGSSAPGSLLPQVISSGPLASGRLITSVPGPPPMPQSFSSPTTMMMPPGSQSFSSPTTMMMSPGSQSFTSVPGPPPMPQSFSSPTTMMMPPGSGSLRTGPVGTTMMMPGTLPPNSGLLQPPSIPPRSFSMQSQQPVTIQPGTLPPGSSNNQLLYPPTTQLPVSGVLPASRVFPSETMLPVAQAMPFSASSIGTSKTLGTSMSMRPPPTMPPDVFQSAYRDLPQSSMRMEPFTQPASRSLQDPYRNTSNPYGDGLLDSEPEVEQGNFTEFMMHHAQQDDIEHNLEDDFGELAFVGNLAPQAQGSSDGMYYGGEVSQEESPYAGMPRTRTRNAQDAIYGMTQDVHQDYQTQLAVYKKAERAPHEKVEHHHVDQCHQQAELAKAGRLEKDLLHIREDQLERRLEMLERIAGAAPNRPRDDNPYSEAELNQDPSLRQQISPFMDKFLPVPLGGGLNWHYFNHHQGFYVDRNKIAQREAQLKHLQEQHQHPFIFALAGKKLEEIPESYWSRDYKSWMEQDQIDQMTMRTPNPFASMGGMGGGMESMASMGGMGGGMPMGSMGGMGGPPTMGGMPPTMGGMGAMGQMPPMGGMGPMGSMGGMGPMGPMGGMGQVGTMGGMGQMGPMGGMGPVNTMGGMGPMGPMGQSMRAF